jgi:peroxiredoxin
MAKAERKPEQAKPLAIFGQVAFVALAAALVYYFVLVTREGEMRRECSGACVLHPNYLGATRRAPDFTLKDMNGKDVRFSDYAGKVVLLNFWSKTCGPCLEEMPEIAELTRILADRKDVAVVAVSIDEGWSDVEPTLRSMLSGGTPPFTLLFDPDSKIVGGKYGTKLFPETWIIDKRGVVRARFDGAKQWSNSAFVQFIDDVRNNTYCPVEINGERVTDKAAHLCEEFGAGGGGS